MKRFLFPLFIIFSLGLSTGAISRMLSINAEKVQVMSGPEKKA